MDAQGFPGLTAVFFLATDAFLQEAPNSLEWRGQEQQTIGVSLADIEFCVPGKIRRSVVTAAAWSVPVTSASPSEIELGAFGVDASCVPNCWSYYIFTLRASPERPLPIGTVITLTSENWGLARGGYEPGYLNVAWPNWPSVVFTVIREMPMGVTTPIYVLADDTGITGKTFIATIILPPGYTCTGAKSSAVLSDTEGVCNIG